MVEDLSCVDDLKKLKKDNGKDYKLTGDIDARKTMEWNDGTGWEPVQKFRGTLDGQGYTIKNLFSNRPRRYAASLFRNLEGSVCNLTLDSFFMNGNYHAAGIASRNEGKIENVTVKDSWIQNIHNGASGAVVAYNYYKGKVRGCRVRNCLIMSERYASGVVGEEIGRNIKECSATNNNIFSGVRSAGIYIKGGQSYGYTGSNIYQETVDGERVIQRID